VRFSGIDPVSLRGSNTGIFLGNSVSETGSVLGLDPNDVNDCSWLGSCRSLFPNHISSALDLRGPSLTVDTACSSSLLAFHLALDSIRLGHCDAALVIGAHLNLAPTTALQFLRLGMLSEEGKCKTFDASGKHFLCFDRLPIKAS
jgi:fatty acid synthase, animal type